MRKIKRRLPKPYYETPLGKLYHGDCLEIMPYLEPVDLVLTDPPYGTTACRWDIVIPFEPMWKQLERIIKKNGVIVLFGNQPFTSALIMSNVKMFKYELIWDKIMPVGHLVARKRIMSVHENILLFYDKKPTFNRQFTERKLEDQRKNIVKNYDKLLTTSKTVLVKNTPETKFSNGYDNTKINPKSIISITKRIAHKDRVHPTQKPVALMEYLIKTYTNEGEVVLDFCIGSGTTSIACERLNRKWIGIEIEEKYCEIAAKRIQEYSKISYLF